MSSDGSVFSKKTVGRNVIEKQEEEEQDEEIER